MPGVAEAEFSPKEIECLHTLYTSDYEEHKERNPDPTFGTCEWFLQHHQYLRWKQAQNSCLLWVSGDPGCGKSVLSKFLVDQLNSSESQATLPGSVCFFFFKDDNVQQKTTNFALCAILHQLFTAKPRLMKHVMPDFLQKGDLITAEFRTLWKILIAAATDMTSGNVICVIDGLDECEESSRNMFMRELAKFYNKSAGQRKTSFLKFIISSRPYLSIQDKFHDMPTIRLKAEDEVASTRGDIERVVKAKIKAFGVKRGLSKDVQSELIERLITNADQTFLWVSLILKMIEDSVKASKAALEQIINTIPGTLDAVYEKILAQSPNIDDATKLIHIIVAASRPLSLDEMNVAFVIRSTDRSKEDLDFEPSIGDTVRNLCGLFIRVIDAKVYLVHQTAKEFLISKSTTVTPALDSGIWKHSFSLADCNLVLAERCLWYLLFSSFDNLPFVSTDGYPLILDAQGGRDILNQYRRDHCFLQYAASHWTNHLKLAGKKDEAVSQLAIDVCVARSKRFFILLDICSKLQAAEGITDQETGPAADVDVQLERLEVGEKDEEVEISIEDIDEITVVESDAAAKEILEKRAIAAKKWNEWTCVDPAICALLFVPQEACTIHNHGEPGFSRTSKVTATIDGMTKAFFLKTGLERDMFVGKLLDLP